MTDINEKLPKEETPEEMIDLSQPATQAEIKSLVDDFNEAFAFRDQQTELKENEITHAFMTINQSIAALNAKIDIALEHIVDKGEMTVDGITNKMKEKLEAAMEMQKKAIEEALAKQKEFVEKEA